MIFPDGLDRTDELLYKFNSRSCYFRLTFSCEKHTCRSEDEELPCGDGLCTNVIESCYNGWHRLLPNNFYAKTVDFFYGENNEMDIDWCENFCTKISYLIHCSQGIKKWQKMM
jgi:hypothetical protein